MTLQQLLYFAEVAKELHFTKAAQMLYVSQSSLSHTIQSLEAELNAPLFARQRGKTVSLSKYGEILLPYVNAALASIKEGTQQVALARSPLSGTIEMAYSHLDGSVLTTLLVEKYYIDEANRKISFHRTVNHTGRSLIPELLRGAADIVISASAQNGNELKSIPMAAQELFVLVPRQHPLSDKGAVTIEDIADCQVSLCGEDSDLIKHVEDMFKSSGCKLRNYKYYSDWATMIASISNGSAITISGKISFVTDTIKTVPLDHPEHMRQLYVVTIDDNEQAPHIQRFWEFCSEYSKTNDSPIF